MLQNTGSGYPSPIPLVAFLACSNIVTVLSSWGTEARTAVIIDMLDFLDQI